MKRIKNNTQTEGTWVGQTIYAGEYYTIQPVEYPQWAINDQVISDIISGNLIMNDGTFDISGINNQIELLKGGSILKDSYGVPIVKTAPFSDAGGFRFRGASFSGVALAGQVTNIEYYLTSERWINGGGLILKNQSHGDSFTFQVIDKDNILGYGAGVILDEFIKDFYIDEEKSSQQQLQLAYPAKIYQGLYLTLNYNSIGVNNVDIKCNLFLHWKAV